jgi:NAD(P)H-flavin reductase
VVSWWNEDENGATIDLIIERKRGFTSRLLEFTHTQKVSSFLVLLDGPYSSTFPMDEYGTVVLFADDIGIAALLLYAKQLVQSSLDNQCVTTKVILIWRYSHEGAYTSPLEGLKLNSSRLRKHCWPDAE